MVVDENLLDRVIFRSTNNSTSSTVYQSRVFEDVNHGIEEISKIDFTNIDVKSLVSTSLQNNDDLLKSMSEDGARKFFYITVVSSKLYHLLLNFVKIPTDKKINNDTTKLHTLTLSLIDKTKLELNRIALNFLCFLGLPLGAELIVEQSILEYIQNNFKEVIDVQIISEHEVNYKFATLDKFEGSYDVLSITKQENYTQRCKEILSYKQNNPDTAKDNNRLDNLQFYMIEQQLYFGLYLSLEPVLALSIAKFSRLRKLADGTGNLFISLGVTEKPLNNSDKVGLLDLIHMMMDFGFFISKKDIEENIRFTQHDDTYQERILNENSIIKRDLKAEELGKNTLYSVLFRLLDESISDELIAIDDLILNKKYSEVDVQLFRILN